MEKTKLIVPEEIAQGKYVNYTFIIFTPAEFVIDFAIRFPGMESAIGHSRIISTPQHVLAISNILLKSLALYEEKYGKIPIIDKGVSMPPSQPPGQDKD